MGYTVPIGISNKHVHLSQEHLEILFGKGHELTPTKPLKQPNQFAAEEKVDIVGPKKTLSGIRVLGPVRAETQVELALTDARSIGIKAPVRESGKLEGTPGCKLVGPCGEIEIDHGVIAALRHVHLNDEAFASDFSKAIAEAKENGVTMMLIPGWDLASSRLARDIARKFDGVYFAAGIQPENITPSWKEDLLEIEKLATDDKCLAIGECGLDYHWDNKEETKLSQKRCFAAQIELANRLGLPLSIHVRDASQDTYEMLREHNALQSAVLHCYSGSPEMLRQFAELGLYFGFDGPITFKNAVSPKECVKECPIDRLLLETDSPYMTPVPFRGKRNEPKYIPLIAEAVSALKDLPLRVVAEKTSDNFIRLFHVKL